MAQVNWYANDVVLAVDKATDELLTTLAFHVEGQAKIHILANGQVDTGFMRNAVYAITPLATHRQLAEAEALSVANRPLAPEAKIAEHGEAAVHGAAEYTIYQETRKPFMYPSLSDAQKLADSTILEVGRKWL